jgi:hypothetical protein
MQYYSFDEKTVQEAVESAKQHFSSFTVEEFSASTADAALSISGGCISVVTQNNKVCVKLPLGFGQHCLPLPVHIPNGTAAQACLTICTTWGFPTGVKVSVIVASITVVSQAFGKC